MRNATCLLIVFLLTCGQPLQAGWLIQTVDSADWVGEYTSLALDSSGFPHISYRDETNGDLKFADGVPEPTTLVLFGLGLLGLGTRLRRRPPKP